MSKRKESETCSDSSDVYDPQPLYNFTPNSPILCVENPNFKKQRTNLAMESEPSSNDIGADVLIQFFDAQLNGAPFFDFFAQEKSEDFVNQPKKPTVADVSPNSPVSYSDGGGPSNSGESSECTEELIEAVPVRMYRPESGIDWTVRKVLTASDCNAQHRLLIKKELMTSCIIPQLDEASRLLIDTPDGLRVTVFDVDMGVELKLTLKKWPSSQVCGLMNNWKRDFVNRRGLIPGDEVGIYWDKSNNRFLFSVLCKLTLLHDDYS
ncbi:uncharacterized protein LOC141586548 [Silene latifolia]|uniref:uncharacterized protein LOC141586548 n=1 Tax=Silene latifolia TaxID=37657 RepID=UPI003D76F115